MQNACYMCGCNIFLSYKPDGKIICDVCDENQNAVVDHMIKEMIEYEAQIDERYEQPFIDS